ncbi:MAG: zinc ribbon domain-containing protein [Armatimonadota bacterium]|nr:zinc ribbon domain-containing protein [bacterium]
MLSCGHCGCSLTAEIKKGKYIYYHCTGQRGKCPEKYVREEEIAKQFGIALKAIRLDRDVLSWVTTALKASHADQKRYRDSAITSLQQQYKKMQNRLDQMYEDKLDGKITQQFFDRKSAEWRNEMAEIMRSIESHQKASESCVDEGIRILELSNRAWELYEKQEMLEKRRLLDFVFSNSTWANGKLTPKYRKPFDLIVEAKKMQDERGDG